MSKTLRKLPDEEYIKFIGTLSTPYEKFKPLEAFINDKNSAAQCNASITTIEFSAHRKPIENIVQENALREVLEKRTENQIFIVENLTPNVLALLGGYCKVKDPQFFLDYLDITSEKYSGEPKEPRYNIVKKPDNPINSTKPWYNIRNIEDHLPSLYSVQNQSNYVVFHFIGPREYRPEDDDAPPTKISERLEPDGSKTRAHRVAGGYNPIQKEGSKHHPVAMTRNYAAVWFDEKPGGGWFKGIILLDPPFESFTAIGGKRQSPMYRSFKLRPSFGEPLISEEGRQTYRTALSDCMLSNTLLENVKNPSQFLVLQDLFKLITSEWLCVNMYIERDLNTIELRLEDNKIPVSFHDFEIFLSSLFKSRRRINKYSTLVEEQLQFCNIRKPNSWNTTSTSPNTKEVFDAIQKDLFQVQEAIQRNRDRIAQSVGLITSLMSVLEGKQSVTQNRRLAFLTILATLLLPFNTTGAILGMQTEYGPGNPRFGLFFRISGGVVGLAIFILVLLYTMPSILERRRRLEMM